MNSLSEKNSWREWFTAPVFAALLALPFYLWLYLPVFSMPALGDDLEFIFHNPVIQGGMSPLLFWTRGHNFTKAWPVFYSLVWATQRLSQDPMLANHTLGLSLHFLNGILLTRLCGRLGIKQAWAAGPLLWFHPAHIVTLMHVMLLTKILSSFFFLLWLGQWIRGTEGKWLAHYWGRLVFLSLSLLSSGQSYLFCLVEGARYLRALEWNRAWWRSPAWAAPFFVISAYGAFLAASGIKTVEAEIQNIQVMQSPVKGQLIQEKRAIVPDREFAPKALVEPPTAVPPAASQAETPVPVAPENGTSELAVVTGYESPEKATGFFDYVANTLGISNAFFETSWISRIRNMGVTALYYVAIFFAPLRLLDSVNLGELPMALQSFFVLAGLGVIASLAYVFQKRDIFWQCMLLAYLPVSGFFYIPFTSHFDLVSPRYAYLPFLPATVICLRWASSKPKAVYGLLAWILILTALSVLELRLPALNQ
jgi:hypothetical protein